MIKHFVIGFCVLLVTTSSRTLWQESSLDCTDVVKIEKIRAERNRNCNLSTARCGDRYVFDLGLRCVQSDHDVQS
ncbi:MAG: hypothetical protein ACE5HS_20610, partial [bacterium]